MQILTLQFDLPLHPGDLSGFRAAIAELVGLEHEYFHNHKNNIDPSQHHWSYPLIQYQVRRGKAQIMAMGKGRDAIYQYLLPKLPTTLAFANQTHRLGKFRIFEQEYNWAISARPFTYGLIHWLALNSNNYANWQKTDSEKTRQVILNKAITGHLRAFAERIGLPSTDIIHGSVLRVDRIKKMTWHKQSFVGFNALIQSNLALPPGPSLGRCVAFGFGELVSEKQYQLLAFHRKKRNPKINLSSKTTVLSNEKVLKNT